MILTSNLLIMKLPFALKLILYVIGICIATSLTVELYLLTFGTNPVFPVIGIILIMAIIFWICIISYSKP